MIHLEIIPDRTVLNKKVHDFFRALSSFYVSPYEQLRGKQAGCLWWDIWMTHENIRFVCTIPETWKREIKMQLENTWPLCAIEETEVPTIQGDVCEMKLRRNNIFALQIDRRLELEPMNSILTITHDMREGDTARLSICVEPVGRLDWQDYAERMHKEFKGGKTPKRRRLTKKDIVVSAGETVTGILQSASDTMDTFMGYEVKKTQEPDYEKRLLMIDGHLSRGTLNKRITPVFNTYIRIAASSPNETQQKIILNTISNSFNDLTADNELERIELLQKLKPIVLRELNEYKLSYWSRLDWDKNKLSNEELGRLVEIPTAGIQDIYGERLTTINQRQIEIPASLLKGGLPLGTVEFKRVKHQVFMPITDHDQLCLPTCVIGGMGSGKTKGFGCNRALGFVEAGYSAVLIDPAKSEVWEIIEKALPKEKRKRILLGEEIISLDFREVLHSPQGRARLAQILFAFFDTNAEETGAQTQRFLRAAVMGMRTGKLREIVDIFLNPKYRKQIIDTMKDGMPKDTLIQFHNEGEARQRQILSPIFNRLDMILGDPYLEKCMNDDRGIDMVKLLSEKGICTVFDVPDRLNTREAKDLLINLISFKIDAAMGLRKETFPVTIILDEPHQYMRSAKLWKNVAVEARKYRLSYVWLFHSWEQIPRDLAQIIKDAGPHFFLYPSSKQTYRGLLEEIHPFDIDDGLNTKRYHAICALKVGDNRMTPFICHMSPPIV